MKLHIFAILILLMPMLSGVGSMLATENHGSQNTNQDTNCCQVVEIVSCCGTVSVEKICPMSGGLCSCAAVPADIPNPPPTPILPQSIAELILEIPETVELVLLNESDDQYISRLIIGDQSLSLPTHNTIQSILGIWRL